MTKKRGLGLKGIDVLFKNDDMDKFNSSVNEKGELVVNIPLELIDTNPNQPRKIFDEESIEALALSIEKVGLLQPISVVGEKGRYMIVAGERRFRAVTRLGKETIKAIVVNADERLVAELSLIENLQREDLNPVDEAEAYLSLTKTHQLTHEQISELVGKSRAHISNFIRLLSMEQHELESLRDGAITVGHAKVLMSAKNKKERKALYEKIVNDRISVREAEKIANAGAASAPKREKETSSKGKVDPQKAEVERRLGDHLGRKVRISSGANEMGSISIDFYSKEDREHLLDILFHVEQ